MTVLPAHGFVDTATVAQHLSVSAAWVRANAAELGAVRLSDSRYGGLRFDAQRVRAAIDRRRVQAERPSVKRRPGRKPGGVVVPADLKAWR